MTNIFDLNLLPVSRIAGRDHPELLGLHASSAPRRPARGRSQDRLILYLVIKGNAPLPPNKLDQILNDLSGHYFKTPGTVTSAMRRLAEELNKVLLERNQRLITSSRQGIGLFTQVVVRGQQVYLSQTGSNHAFLITSNDVKQYFDPENAGQGLGQDRITRFSLFLLTLEMNDTLILSALMPPDWNKEVFSSIRRQGPESLRRRLVGQPLVDLNAIFVQVKPGKGSFFTHWLQIQPEPKTGTELHSIAEMEGVPETKNLENQDLTLPRPDKESGFVPSEGKSPPPVGDLERSTELAAPVGVDSESVSGQLISPIQSVQSDSGKAPGQIQFQPVEGPSQSQQKSKDAGIPEEDLLIHKTKSEKQKRSFLEPILLFFIAIGTPILKVWNWTKKQLLGLLVKMLPSEYISASEPFVSIPSSIMAIVAIIIPVVIVTIASLTYFRLGRTAQYEILFSQAERMASQAIVQTDLLTKRAELEATLDILQRVDFYMKTTETQTLRAQVRQALDELELIRRVDYQSIILNGLPVTVDISRMVVSYGDLYLLDKGSGRVIRAELNDQEYEIDTTFSCGPGASGGGLIGPVIDIASWPAGYLPEANLVAIDASGNLLFCSPNENPITDKLTAPASESWGGIVGFSLDLGDLYVLDLPSNGVWIYWRSNLAEEPTMYFDEVTPTLSDVIDLEVNKSDLYLLHQDGHLTLCFLGTSGITPTRCSEASYVDLRPGRENTTLIPPGPFSQVVASSPPDPSLFLLEPTSHSIYHFSLRNLAFQRQYLPTNSLPASPASAFAIDTIHRSLYLAIGNQVYYAIMP